MYYYRLYGLTLAATQPLADLHPADPTPTPDVQISPTTTPAAHDWQPQTRLVSLRPADQGTRPVLQVWASADGTWWQMRYRAGALNFGVRHDGGAVTINADPTTWADGSYSAFLKGPVMGMVLRLRGIVPLHASVVRVAGQALAFIGPSGIGKSTLASNFALAGYGVLTDDIAPLVEHAGRWWVEPGYPRLRLWAAAIPTSGARITAQVVPGHDKFYVEVADFETSPLPLARVYVIENRDEQQTPPAIITPLSGHAALLALLRHSYANYLLDPAMRATEFRVLGQVAQAVSVRHLSTKHALAALDAVREMIIDDSQYPLD